MSDSEQLSSRIRVNPQPSGKIGKSERTRAAILNAAVDFLWTHPFREMTINSLMAPTGVGRSAFYQYFKDLQRRWPESGLPRFLFVYSEANTP